MKGIFQNIIIFVLAIQIVNVSFNASVLFNNTGAAGLNGGNTLENVIVAWDLLVELCLKSNYNLNDTWNSDNTFQFSEIEDLYYFKIARLNVTCPLIIENDKIHFYKDLFSEKFVDQLTQPPELS